MEKKHKGFETENNNKREQEIIFKCPFCAKDRAALHMSVKCKYYIACENCGANGPHTNTRIYAYELWNRVAHLYLFATGKIRPPLEVEASDNDLEVVSDKTDYPK